MSTNAFNLNNLRLAVLIDAENVPRKSIKSVMEEVAIYGTPTIKRIYGDWTSPMIAGWKTSLLENAITPIQQYSYTTGKNSSDSAMIIDAMDILYSERTDGFVIVSSDSDFTRLAIRLREAGQRVIGIGERKTPSAFIAACDKFTYIEVIRAGGTDTRSEPDDVPTPDFDRRVSDYDRRTPGLQSPTGEYSGAPDVYSPGVYDIVVPVSEIAAPYGVAEAGGDHSGPADGDAAADEAHAGGDDNTQKTSVQQKDKHHHVSTRQRGLKVPKDIVRIIADSVADLAGDDGVVFMGELGNLILKKQPDFDSRNFGYKSLSALIKSISRFEIEFRQTTDPNIKHVFVRDKEAN